MDAIVSTVLDELMRIMPEKEAIELLELWINDDTDSIKLPF